MAQKTAKTVEDVLEWIETTSHHKGAWIGPDDAPTHLVLSGHRNTLRIPRAVHLQVMDLMQSGGPFDDRMFRATPAGKARLTRWRKREGR